MLNTKCITAGALECLCFMFMFYGNIEALSSPERALLSCIIQDILYCLLGVKYSSVSGGSSSVGLG